MPKWLICVPLVLQWIWLSLRFGGATGAPKPTTAIIYADRCLLTKPFMTQHGIVFKKIPRDISRF